MTIASLLKSAKSAYNGERANLVCEILLAHFLGKERVFLHANSEKKISEILKFSVESKKDLCEAPENSPASWCKKSGEASSSASADFLLEAEKRGSPPKSEKRQLLARRGSGAGGAALLRKEKNSNKSAESIAKSVDSAIFALLKQ